MVRRARLHLPGGEPPATGGEFDDLIELPSHADGEQRLPSRIGRKQVSLNLPRTDWQHLRGEAVRHRLSVTGLLMQYLEPHLAALRAGAQ